MTQSVYLYELGPPPKKKTNNDAAIVDVKIRVTYAGAVFHECRKGVSNGGDHVRNNVLYLKLLTFYSPEKVTVMSIWKSFSIRTSPFYKDWRRFNHVRNPLKILNIKRWYINLLGSGNWRNIVMNFSLGCLCGLFIKYIHFERQHKIFNKEKWMLEWD